MRLWGGGGGDFLSRSVLRLHLSCPLSHVSQLLLFAQHFRLHSGYQILGGLDQLAQFLLRQDLRISGSQGTTRGTSSRSRQPYLFVCMAWPSFISSHLLFDVASEVAKLYLPPGHAVLRRVQENRSQDDYIILC